MKCLIRGAEFLAGVAARTEPSGGEYEKHLRTERHPKNQDFSGTPQPQDWTGGGNFTRHVCRELN